MSARHHHRLARLGLLPVAAAIVMLAGCGSSSEPESASAPSATDTSPPPETSQPSSSSTTTMPLAAPTDPCTLVTLDEAQGAIGSALNPGTVAGNGEELSCTYTGPTTGPLAQVEVFVGDGAKKFLDIDRDLGHTFTDVAEVGDEATVEPGTIFVRIGATWFAIRMTTLDDLTLLQPTLETLARNAASRIPAV